MESYEDYCELIECLNALDDEGRRRRKHRLPMECYAASDCEFFFTLCARHLGEPFTSSVISREVLDSLLWRKQLHRWMLFCYCLMPDHLHFIVRLRTGDVNRINAGARGLVPESILDQIGNFKKYTTTQVWWKHGGQGLLWQKSSYDRVIRYNESVQEAVSYVLNNPVRKGLMKRWDDYPNSSVVDPW